MMKDIDMFSIRRIADCIKTADRSESRPVGQPSETKDSAGRPIVQGPQIRNQQKSIKLPDERGAQ